MATQLKTTASVEQKAHDSFGRVEVHLPSEHNCDVALIFPNGQRAELQYRLESPSIDFCFPEHVQVTNWTEQMEPAPVPGTHDPDIDSHVRRVVQLVIDFDPAWLDEPA